MTTIKIGNQEVELEAARNLLFDANHPDTGQSTAAKSAAEALSAAIKEAEEVEGPFGRWEGVLKFRGEFVVSDYGRVEAAHDLPATLNRILSQHFVSKDELREALAAGAGVAHRDYYSQINRMRKSLTALIEKGAPDA